jgi:hypothetical protein
MYKWETVGEDQWEEKGESKGYVGVKRIKVYMYTHTFHTHTLTQSHAVFIHIYM